MVKMVNFRSSLAVQWLRLRTSKAGGAGSIPGRGTKMPYATGHGQKKKKKGTFYVMCTLPQLKIILKI